jgi:hypothetical protein
VFQALKQSFITAPVLSHADCLKPFVLETDASSFAIGCILSQKVNGRFHPCGFYSRKLTPTEMNYPVFDRELLAIKEGFNQWRHLLEGSKYPVKVITDHQNLKHLSNAKVTNSRHANWALFFSRFNFEIEYCKGVDNGKPDALSRRADYKPEGNRFNEEQTILPSKCVVAPIGYKSTPREITDLDLKRTVLRFFHDSHLLVILVSPRQLNLFDDIATGRECKRILSNTSNHVAPVSRTNPFVRKWPLTFLQTYLRVMVIHVFLLLLTVLQSITSFLH